MLTYGGGSIKKNGIYDEVIKALKDARKEVFEDPGVMSNQEMLLISYRQVNINHRITV